MANTCFRCDRKVPLIFPQLTGWRLGSPGFWYCPEHKAKNCWYWSSQEKQRMTCDLRIPFGARFKGWRRDDNGDWLCPKHLQEMKDREAEAKLSPAAWAQKLEARKDYRGLAEAFNRSRKYSDSSIWGERSSIWSERMDHARKVLRSAGAAAVEDMLAEFSDSNNVRLAEELFYIGDERAAPALKKMLDRGAFDAYGLRAGVEQFISKYAQAAGEVEQIACALCQKTTPITEARSYFDRGEEKWFCKSTCWSKRGKVVKSGFGYPCPFYNEGMCLAGEGDNLCSLEIGYYATDCHVYKMFSGQIANVETHLQTQLFQQKAKGNKKGKKGRKGKNP